MDAPRRVADVVAFYTTAPRQQRACFAQKENLTGSLSVAPRRRCRIPGAARHRQPTINASTSGHRCQ
jgi:hypothetical protein